MKTSKLIFAVAILLISAAGMAQNRTGFGGPSFNYTTLNGQNTWEAGGFGGYHFTPNFYVGGGGYGISPNGSYENFTSLGYGGLLVGYVLMPTKKVHVNARVLGAFGGVEYVSNSKYQEDGVGVFKITLETEIKLSVWAQLGLGGGYRLITGSDLINVSSNDLSSYFLSATLRFGEFKTGK